MKYIFTPLDEANARTIQSWNYEAPYNIYDWETEDDISEMLDRGSPQHAVKDEQGELIGFFAYGSSAYVWDSGEPHLFSENNTYYSHLRRRKYQICMKVMMPMPNSTIQNKAPLSCSKRIS